MGWKDDKDLGPWNFTEQGDKYGYLNNKRWSSQQDAQEFCEDIGISLDPTNTHKPCGHWHKDRPGIGEIKFPSGRWAAAMPQPGQPYIYLYDIAYKAIIKVDTSLSPPAVVDRLIVNDSSFNLDYDMGHGLPGAQRGSYCMNKNGTRVWYLFRGVGDYDDDCKLVEIDISSSPMSLVKSTIIENLMPTYLINDGCSDNDHTYWCTTLNVGEIIKINNTSHSVVEDKLFNFTYPDEPIASIDVDVNTDILYWIYAGACGGTPLCNAIAHYMRSDTDFNNIVDVTQTGQGLATPWWQNFIRVYGNYLLHHRAYWPSAGAFYRRDLAYGSAVGYAAEYLQNILGIKDGILFILRHDNNLGNDGYLNRIQLSNMTNLSSLQVNYYTGHGYLTSWDWDWTSVSALGDSTGVVMLFRWHNLLNANFGASFDSSLNLLYDERMDYIVTKTSPEYLRENEPQVWPMD